VNDQGFDSFAGRVRHLVSRPAPDDSGARNPRAPRPPTLLDALAPVVVLITLLFLAMVLYGVDAANGPLQVALLVSAAFAALVAYKNGYTFAVLQEAAIGGVSSAMGAVFILLAVGALIGTWNLAGTIPTIVSYGLALLRPAIFFATVAVICALVGAVTGSSWTTAGTLGVAFVGMAPILGMSEPITAGAVISGGYMGDKMSPLSETTVLVPQLVGGVTTNEHIKGMLATVVPSFGLAFLIFLGIGFAQHNPGTTIDTTPARNALASVYNISPVNLLPLLLLVVLSLRRAPAFLSILGTALFSGILASFTQPHVVEAFVNKPGQGAFLNGIDAIFQSMATGHVAHSPYPAINDLFSRGGMASMLTTVWLILGALSFAAIMEHAGFIDRLLRPLVHRAKTDGQLIATVAVSCFGLNLIAGDQYVADVLPSRAFRPEFAERGLAPRMLSRTVEDSGTVTSPLVPWNSCGAYMAGVLGVPTVEYLPYAFFNMINPVLAIIFGFTGYRVEHKAPAAEPSVEPVGAT
jgi:NhaC family Na+:H+ antiporter